MKLSEMFKGMLLSQGYVTSVRRLREFVPDLVAAADAPASTRGSPVDRGAASGPAGHGSPSPSPSPSPRDACPRGSAIACATR